jgi:hypothetical protein
VTPPVALTLPSIVVVLSGSPRKGAESVSLGAEAHGNRGLYVGAEAPTPEFGGLKPGGYINLGGLSRGPGRPASPDLKSGASTGRRRCVKNFTLSAAPGFFWKL